MNRAAVASSRLLYQTFLRPIFFQLDCEAVHSRLTALGERIGRTSFLRDPLAAAFAVNNPALKQGVGNLTFANPIGLAAGFDYQARLPQILPALGFGFGTVGTISNLPYEGNPPPRLGRLVRSRSLMVNKGFKNPGIRTVLNRLADQRFSVPIGISLGRTNTPNHRRLVEAIDDIILAFQALERRANPFSYYELNISCPNLRGKVDFYQAENLKDLLAAVTDQNLSRPLLVKMPISLPDRRIIALLEVISRYPIQGVIFGNLQKNRQTPGLIPAEAAKFPLGSFSGKPTEARSNQLIELAYRHFHPRLTIIGCGGVFSSQDAYRKITLGASLVQLITGLVFCGPQLPAEINLGLIELLGRDGIKTINQAVGSRVA